MSENKKKKTTDIARELMEPIAQELGLEIWDIAFEKEGSQWYLRYFLDKEDGINIQECEAASRAVSDKLDKVDPISQNYILEVGSPGIDRLLKTDNHFGQYMGSTVLVRLIRPVDNKRDFVGTLLGKDGQEVTIELEDDLQMTFSLVEAAYVRLHEDFEIGG